MYLIHYEVIALSKLFFIFYFKNIRSREALKIKLIPMFVEKFEIENFAEKITLTHNLKRFL